MMVSKDLNIVNRCSYLFLITSIKIEVSTYLNILFYAASVILLFYFLFIKSISIQGLRDANNEWNPNEDDDNNRSCLFVFLFIPIAKTRR